MNGFRSHKKLKFLPTIIVLGVAILSGVVVKRAFFPADADADSFSQLEERFAEIQSTSVVRQNEYFEFLSSSESPLDAMDIDEILSLEKDDETMIFYMQEFNDRTKKNGVQNSIKVLAEKWTHLCRNLQRLGSQSMAEMRDDLNVVHFGGNSIAAHLEDAQATLETLSSDVTQALTKIEEGRKIDGNLGPAIENLGIAP